MPCGITMAKLTSNTHRKKKKRIESVLVCLSFFYFLAFLFLFFVVIATTIRAYPYSLSLSALQLHMSIRFDASSNYLFLLCFFFLFHILKIFAELSPSILFYYCQYMTRRTILYIIDRCIYIYTYVHRTKRKKTNVNLSIIQNLQDELKRTTRLSINLFDEFSFLLFFLIIFLRLLQIDQ